MLFLLLSLPGFASPLPTPASAGAQAPHLTAEGRDIRLTWFEPSGDDVALKTAVRNVAGVWTEPATIAESAEFFVNWADTPSVTRGGDGTWVAHFAEKSAADTYAYDVMVATSTDGERWTRVGPVHDDGTPTEHGFVSTWPTSDGVGLVWLDGRETAAGGAMTLRTGVMPGAPNGQRVLDDRVCDCCGTSMALAPDGVPVVAYRNRSESEIRDIQALRFDSDQPVSVGEDGWQIAGCPVNGPRLATSGSAMLAAWTTAPAGATEVRVAASKDGGRSFGEAHTLAAGEPMPLGRVDLVPLGDEQFVATWLHSLGGGRAEVRARRIEVEPGQLQVGAEQALGEAEAARSAGFPRAVAQGDELLVVWSSEAGLEMSRTAIASISNVETHPDTVTATALGTPSRPERLPTLEGTQADGAPWALLPSGKATLVTLWASWCGPCRSELPALVELASRDDLELVVLAVDDAPPRARAALGDTGLQPVFVSSEAVRGAFGTSTVPASYLFDAQGDPMWNHAGPIDAQHVSTALSGSKR